MRLTRPGARKRPLGSSYRWRNSLATRSELEWVGETGWMSAIPGHQHSIRREWGCLLTEGVRGATPQLPRRGGQAIVVHPRSRDDRITFVLAKPRERRAAWIVPAVQSWRGRS